MAYNCPHCCRIITNRKNNICEYCKEILPEELLLSEEQKEALKKIKIRDRIRHLTWKIDDTSRQQHECDVGKWDRIDALQKEKSDLKYNRDRDRDRDKKSHSPIVYTEEDRLFLELFDQTKDKDND